MPTIAERRATYRQLHASGCFVMPNPWDIGSARYLQGQGFKALASTSAGFAFTLGLPDGAVSRDTMLAHLRELVAATDVPINADYEGGYADAPEGVAESVRLCVETGVAGLSIEDSTSDPTIPLYDFDLALARVRAARAAIKPDSGVVFTARSEGFVRGRPDLPETIRRLKAYAEAGADCLYAPGIKTREEIAAVVQAVAPKPVNFLMMGAATGLTVGDLTSLGVRRISLGGTLARATWTALKHSAREMLDDGKFTRLAGTVSNPELNAFFHEDMAKRGLKAAS